MRTEEEEGSGCTSAELITADVRTEPDKFMDAVLSDHKFISEPGSERISAELVIRKEKEYGKKTSQFCMLSDGVRIPAPDSMQ